MAQGEMEHFALVCCTLITGSIPVPPTILLPPTATRAGVDRDPGDALVSSEHTLRGLLELTELLTDARRLGCGRDARHDEQL
jgi:hypothetical protein